MVQEISAAAANDAALTQTIHTVGNTVCTTVYDPVHTYVPLARIHARMDANGQVETDQTVLYYHTDQLGTPLALTEASGKVRWAGRLRTWGALEAQQAEEPVAQPLRFQGQYADEETGLHYNTFRYDDPDVGRFINQDPIGLWGGDNFYRYAPNPTGWVDPWGWCKKPVNWKSTKEYGHAFIRHGKGKKITEKLTDRAKTKNTPQGQWLDNQKAAELISSVDLVPPSVTIPIPKGLGQVILPSGKIVPATHAILVPRNGGVFETAYPIIE